MTVRTAAEERRAAVRLLYVSVLTLAVMLALWWLVENTNREGTHDAELLPFVTIIPLVMALSHLVRGRARR